MPETSNCGSCKAPVLFVPSATTGQLMILNAKPVETGNIAIVDGKAVVMRGDLFEQMVSDGPRYIDHHATCPDLAKWRNKKRKDKP